MVRWLVTVLNRDWHWPSHMLHVLWGWQSNKIIGAFLVAVRFNCISQIFESIAPRTPMISVWLHILVMFVQYIGAPMHIYFTMPTQNPLIILLLSELYQKVILHLSWGLWPANMWLPWLQTSWGYIPVVYFGIRDNLHWDSLWLRGRSLRHTAHLFLQCCITSCIPRLYY